MDGCKLRKVDHALWREVRELKSAGVIDTRYEGFWGIPGGFHERGESEDTPCFAVFPEDFAESRTATQTSLRKSSNRGTKA